MYTPALPRAVPLLKSSETCSEWPRRWSADSTRPGTSASPGAPAPRGRCWTDGSADGGDRQTTGAWAEDAAAAAAATVDVAVAGAGAASSRLL